MCILQIVDVQNLQRGFTFKQRSHYAIRLPGIYVLE